MRVITILLIISVLSLICFSTAYAQRGEHDPNPTAPGGNADDEDVAPPKFNIDGGPTAGRTGWMIYIVDEYGLPVSADAKFILTSSSFSIGSNFQSDMAARLGGYSTSAYSVTDLNAQWGAPFTTTGQGRGNEVKQWMLTPVGESYNVVHTIAKYWGESTALAFQDSAKEDSPYYFIMEPIYWNQMYKNGEATGKWLIGTARGIANLQNANGVEPTGDYLIRKYTNNLYGNGVKFEFTQFEIPYGTNAGVCTNAEIMSGAYGIMSIWAGLLEEEPEEIPREPVETEDGDMYVVKNFLEFDSTYEENAITGTPSAIDNQASNDMYAAPKLYTYNTCNSFNLGEAIPTTESYTNHVKTSSWYGTATLSHQERSQIYSIPYQYVYFWIETTTVGSMEYPTEENAENIREVVTPDGSMWYWDISEKFTEVRTSSVHYEFVGNAYYIKKANFYEADQSKVREKLYHASKRDEIGTGTIYGINPEIPFSIICGGQSASTGSMVTVESFGARADYHISFPTVNTSLIVLKDEYDYDPGEYMNMNELGMELRNRKLVTDSSSSIEHKVSEEKHVKCTNDYLSLNGDVYINDVKENFRVTSARDGKTVTITTHAKLTSEGPLKDEVAEDTLKKGLIYKIPKQSNDWMDASYGWNEGEQMVMIPQDTTNGHYYTSHQATYSRIVATGNATPLDIVLDDGKNALWRNMKYAILAPYRANEPIIVHSPSISPAHIDGEDTQLLPPSVMTELSPGALGYHSYQANCAQLKLDGTYDFVYDWKQLFQYTGYGNPAGFTKYIKEKYVRFPFSVMIDGTYFEPIDGFTEWIPVGATTTSFEFYVPTWAREGIYSYDANNGSFEVETKVLANNEGIKYYEGIANTNIAEQYEYNASLDCYVATYHIPAQISGVIYDFQVVGVNDVNTFSITEKEEDAADLRKWAHLATEKQERNVGVNNRFGESNVRYTKDGLLNNNWPTKFTLPFAGGRTNDPSIYNGFLKRGHSFSFTIKTIANLWKNDDTLEINTDFSRYINPDGTIEDNPLIYYSIDDNAYMLYGDDSREQFIIKDATLDGMRTASANVFKDSYFDYFNTNTFLFGPSESKKINIYDTFWNTARIYSYYWDDNETERQNGINELKFTVNNIGTPSHISIPSSMRLFTANEEELEINKDKTVNTASRYNASSNNLATLERFQYDSFGYSMQTWYGQYDVPDNLMKLDEKKLWDACDEKGVEITGVTRPATTGTDESKEYSKELLRQYWVDIGITGKEDFWITEGYLVLNFDIWTTHKKEGHLTYYRGTDNMWTTEADASVRYVSVYDKYRIDNIPVYDGDVAIISLDSNRWNGYSAGILYIN